MMKFFKKVYKLPLLGLLGLLFSVCSLSACSDIDWNKYLPWNMDSTASAATTTNNSAEQITTSDQPLADSQPDPELVYHATSPAEAASSHLPSSDSPDAVITEPSGLDGAFSTFTKFLPSFSTGPLKTALLLPLSGASKATGEAMQTAAMMALSESGNDKMILQFYDTKGTPEGAAAAAEAALAEGAKLILGPLYSAETKAVADVVGWGNVKILTFSSDPSVLGGNVYSLALLQQQQIEEVVHFACERGYHNFAFLSPSGDMGEYSFAAAKSAAEDDFCAGAITKMGFYDATATDFSSAIREILPEAILVKLEREALKDQGYEVLDETLYDSDGNVIDEKNITFDFDAVILIDEGARLRSVAALLEYYDIDTAKIKVLGLSPMGDARAKKESALKGAWYAALPERGFASFSSRYKALGGGSKTPPRIASLAYDAVSLTAYLAKQGTVNATTLTDSAGFMGTDGVFRLLPDGRSERSLNIMEVRRTGANKVIKAAPKHFASATSDSQSVQRATPALTEKEETSQSPTAPASGAEMQDKAKGESSVMDNFLNFFTMSSDDDKAKDKDKANNPNAATSPNSAAPSSAQPVYDDAPKIEADYYKKK